MKEQEEDLHKEKAEKSKPQEDTAEEKPHEVENLEILSSIVEDFSKEEDTKQFGQPDYE